MNLALTMAASSAKQKSKYSYKPKPALAEIKYLAEIFTSYVCCALG